MKMLINVKVGAEAYYLWGKNKLKNIYDGKVPFNSQSHSCAVKL